MTALLVKLGLFVVAATVAQVSAQCCTSGQTSDFCTVFQMLSTMEQAEVMSILGENCDGDADAALKTLEKRKPNFMRYGRSGALGADKKSNDIQFGKKGSDPNFLRFGRSQPNFLRFGKAAVGDPNFLRFGRSDPNFLRFGKAAADPNFLRFGRSIQQGFDRELRKPNFLRFGK